MPPEGLVIHASVVIETTGGDHTLAALAATTGGGGSVYGGAVGTGRVGVSGSAYQTHSDVLKLNVVVA